MKLSRILAFLVLIACSLPMNLAAQAEVKSLQKGNSFHYSITRSRLPVYFSETVVGDSVVSGTSYAVLYNSLTRAYRLERSTDNELYTVVSGREQFLGKMIAVPGDSLPDITLADIGCTPCRFKVARMNTNQRIWGNTMVLSLLLENVTGSSQSGLSDIGIVPRFGIVSARTNLQASPQQRTVLQLRGAVLGGMVYGDTVKPVLPTPIPDNIRAGVTLSAGGANQRTLSASSAITYTLPKERFVQLSIYLPNGRKVRSLLQSAMPAGTHTIQWDGKNERNQSVPSGMYVGLLVLNGQEAARIDVVKN
jgi:hypothetical protein